MLTLVRCAHVLKGSVWQGQLVGGVKHSVLRNNSAVQSQKAVSAYFTSEQILLLDLQGTID